MYDRYKDISKFITDPDKLEIANDGYVYISGENDYDIAVDMEDCYGSFDEVKPYIAIIASHINELDNLAQRFKHRKRVKKNGYSAGLLSNPHGPERYDYNKTMEDDPDPRMQRFPFELAVIYIEKPNFVTFDYWCTDFNSEIDVEFEFKDGKFFLRRFNAIALIPDDWDDSYWDKKAQRGIKDLIKPEGDQNDRP